MKNAVALTILVAGLLVSSGAPAQTPAAPQAAASAAAMVFFTVAVSVTTAGSTVTSGVNATGLEALFASQERLNS